MRKSLLVAALAFAVLATMPETASAYFGPGAGVTMLGALWGVILAVAFALFAFLAWPIRAMLRRRKKAAAEAAAGSGGAAAPEAQR
jgi:ABC-type sulfate transport system permease component